MTAVDGWAEIGERVREARTAARQTQAELAELLRLDRTAVAKIEAGTRQLSALELFRLSDVLSLPIAHFVLRPPDAIISRRSPLLDEPDLASRSGYFLDADLAAHARDAQWLIESGFLDAGARLRVTRRAAVPKDGRELARSARRALGNADAPLGELAAVCEAFGLFVLPVDRDAEGASLSTADYGVAVIGAGREPGRRRWTAAHELGHHLLGDAYHSDVGVAASERDREAVIDAFAAEFLLPQAAVSAARHPEDSVRTRLIRLAGSYRVSWAAVVLAARRADVVTDGQMRSLRSETPTRGDFLEVLGYEPATDLDLGETGPAWRTAVLAAWRAGTITAARAVELVHGQLGADDLPRRELPDLGA
jgi:Zn-dependent peptidase ImmA (M78 family)/DNA-binding XRE family transcriptional regulator